MPPTPDPRDPWRRAPVGELGEQLLPRWFVLLAIAAIPLALGALIAAFLLSDPGPGPVAERRPPPAQGLSHDVGDLVVGEAAPAAWDAGCPQLAGLRIAGTDADRAVLEAGLAPLCDVVLPQGGQRALADLAQASAAVRFAAFARTGVDSTARTESDPPVVLLNNKLTFTDPWWIAPLVVHDAVTLAGEPGTVATALAARTAEAAVCDQLFAGERRASRGCGDAAELLALDDPGAALRAAGYR